MMFDVCDRDFSMSPNGRISGWLVDARGRTYQLAK